jgi:hypothetical protein
MNHGSGTKLTFPSTLAIGSTLRGDAPLTAEPVRAELTRFNPATDALLADAEEFGDLVNGPHATSPATISDLRHLRLL